MPSNNDNENIEQQTVWPSNDGFALDDTHYVPSDELSEKDELKPEEQEDIDDFLSSNYEDGDLGSSHDDAEYGLDEGELEDINDSLEADKSLAYEDVITIPKDTVLMRYVDVNKKTDTGEFLTEPGTPKEQLALDPSREYQAHYYKLDSDLDVHAGTARSWFGDEGGGVQYKLTDNERVNTLRGLDGNGNPVEGGKSVITECNEDGEPIDPKEQQEQSDNTGSPAPDETSDKTRKDTTPFYEKEGFQKVVTFATAAIGLATAAINAKDMPNKIDMQNALNDRPSISITIDNRNINSDDISDMLEDMGYSLEKQNPEDLSDMDSSPEEQQDQKDIDDNDYSLDDAVIDAGQAIEDLGSDEGNLYERVKDSDNNDDEELDILNSELDGLYSDNSDKTDDLGGDDMPDDTTDELDDADKAADDSEQDEVSDDLSNAMEDLGYDTDAADDDPETTETFDEPEDNDTDRNII